MSLGGSLQDQRPTIINFRPWLIGNRDALITNLFGELSRQLDQVALNADDATRISVTKAKEAGEALRSFMNGLSRAGAVIEFAGEASGIGLLKLFGKGAKAAVDAAGKKPAPPPLSELKDNLLTSLRNLGHQFGPSHALTRDDFTSMWAAAEAGAEEAGTALLHLHDEHATGSLTKADLLREHVKSGVYEVLAPGQRKNLLVALSQVMDEGYRRHPFDQFWVSSLWERAERPIPLLLSRLEPAPRAAVVTTMFSEGAAIGWLTSLFRHETFAHGRYGDRLRPEDERLFTNAELDRITEIMLGRYRAMSASDVFGCPDPISLLFAWRQGGDEQGPRRLVEANIVSDEGLIETLEHLASTIYSSDRGKVGVLKKENLAPFMDYKNATQRIHALTDHNDLGARAAQLAIALDDGGNY
jgi:hypothetical protein